MFDGHRNYGSSLLDFSYALVDAKGYDDESVKGFQSSLLRIELFAGEMAFYFSGAIRKGVTNRYQLRMFDEAVAEQGGDVDSASKSWADAFSKLRKLLAKH